MTVFQAPEGYVALDDSNNLFKKILQEGTGELANRSGSTVKVHYTGSLFDNGDVFDSSVDRGTPFEFTLGKGQVIKGWDVGIASMRIGEKADLLILSEYGYGAQGSPPKIPGGATLLFNVELLDVDLSTAELSIQEKIAKAKELKEKGNELFKKQEFSEAAKVYQQAENTLSNTWGAEPEEGNQIKDLKVSLYSNIAAASLKTKDAKQAQIYCKKTIEIEENHEKANFRLYQALTMLGKFEEAVELLETKKEILKGIDVDQEILRVRKQKAQAIANEKKVYSKMFA
ncbi:cytochrome P450 monooxygenase 9 [Boothiomyces sp. JEL0838]|nr:cytochrome P450 monooxygenase 9 [Boothiomyces sp. JEL0838]